MSELQLYNEILTLPISLQKEVEDFVQFLKYKYDNKPQPKQRVFGSAKGFFKMSDDFDEPLDDFNEYME
jgi:hypothetical protein